jgi:acyl-CoA thioesterase
MDAYERARRSCEAMWASDRASPWLGMEKPQVDAGRAIISMQVAGHHCNGHGICHGGVIFALADSAFAFACNSHNEATVAQSNNIVYLAPGRLGDRLTATAVEVSRTGRSGVTDVEVTNQDGRPIALFRGLSRTIGGKLFEEEA